MTSSIRISCLHSTDTIFKQLANMLPLAAFKRNSCGFAISFLGIIRSDVYFVEKADWYLIMTQVDVALNRSTICPKPPYLTPTMAHFVALA